MGDWPPNITVHAALEGLSADDHPQYALNRVVTTVASSATPTPAVGTRGTDIIYIITAQAEDATFGAPTGTPVSGQQLVIRITDDGTARALSWNAIYDEGDDLALPLTTVAGKTMYLNFVYNSTAVKWQFIGQIGGF